MEKYYIVDGSILPESFDKVIKARKLIESGKTHQVSDAVKQVGISRGTYYKYKDLVFLPDENRTTRKALVSMMLEHEQGLLSKVLMILSDANASVLTINQNIPIHDLASVVLSFDISNLSGTIDDLLGQLTDFDGISNVQLISIE
ncbi:ACT domain-containing protein [Companilactobacillus furfuricola]|uniref:ACT domain-containing protein n=1 Tax=Companilactobacillus furfuricola TaxID=1462575 RepID=UPI000F7A734F|nr:ACT domain-containing protein [Companilactobacillus furfuricola]